MGVASAISWGVGVLVLIAFIAAIATVVRRHRPDATPILLGAMIFEALISLVAYLTQLALPRFLSVTGPSGSGSYMEAYALSSGSSVWRTLQRDCSCCGGSCAWRSRRIADSTGRQRNWTRRTRYWAWRADPSNQLETSAPIMASRRRLA